MKQEIIILISNLARIFPIQDLGPPENGKKTNVSSFYSALSNHLSGKKSCGFLK